MELKPPRAGLFMDKLRDRLGVVGVWITHGVPCLNGHYSCTTYLVLVADQQHAEVARDLGEILPTVAGDPMCWAIAPTSMMALKDMKPEWERIAPNPRWPEGASVLLDRMKTVPSVDKIWVMHGAPCPQKRPRCTGFMIRTKTMDRLEVVDAMQAAFAESEAIRLAEMCWAVATPMLLPDAKVPPAWEELDLLKKETN